MEGGNSGAVIIPEDYESSLLWQRLDSGEMPEGGDPLSQADIDLIANWITQGANICDEGFSYYPNAADEYDNITVQDGGTCFNDDDLDTHFGAEFDIGLIKNEDGHTQTRLTATPPNFTKVARIVKEFLDNGAYTNETCGFHAHFGLGKLEKTSGMDTTWFTAYFIESGLFKNYQTYKGIPQYEEGEYASINELEGSVDGFRASLDNLTAKENKLAFAHQQTVDKLHMGIFDKYNVLNPHHQGTLEWRGLRGVFDNMSGQANNYNEIVDLCEKLGPARHDENLRISFLRGAYLINRITFHHPWCREGYILPLSI